MPVLSIVLQVLRHSCTIYLNLNDVLFLNCNRYSIDNFHGCILESQTGDTKLQNYDDLCGGRYTTHGWRRFNHENESRAREKTFSLHTRTLATGLTIQHTLS